MKLRKILTLTLTLALCVCFTAVCGADDSYVIPPEWERPTVDDIETNWQTANWIQVYERDSGGDYSGVQFELSTFVKEVDRADEGFYEWIFIADAFGDALGCYFKVLTQDGDSADLAFKRFTSWGDYEGNPIKGEAVMVTRFEDKDGDTSNGTEEGQIPAEFIMQAAEAGQRMRLQTQGDTRGFQVKEIIINHYLDGELGEPTRIYAMSEDPLIQDLEIGASFDGGSLGLIRSGNATFLISNADNLDPEPLPEENTEAPAEEPAEEADAATNDVIADDAATEDVAADTAPADNNNDSAPANASADDSGLSNTAVIIIIIVAVVVIAAVAVFVVIKNKKK